MEYELKFYFGSNTEEVQFLGSYKLADLMTYNHYKTLTENNVPFSIWFEHFDTRKWHRNILVDNTAIICESFNDIDMTKALIIITPDKNKLKFLTQEEFNDQNKVNELINQLKIETITRLIQNQIN